MVILKKPFPFQSLSRLKHVGELYQKDGDNTTTPLETKSTT